MADSDLDPSWPLGLDVSHYQGTVDWASLAQQGYRFAFAKAPRAGPAPGQYGSLCGFRCATAG
jgi:hypothetical protein